MTKILINTLIFLVISVILVFSIRGNYGSPSSKELISTDWIQDGPLELSPERGRFGLTYSLLEDKSFYFTNEVAHFILPDLGYKNGNYVSLFAPAVSYLVMPGYLVGKYFGITQFGAYSVIAVFGLINLLLIKKLVREFNGSEIVGWISGIIFLFATPAYAYASNLYQHHISTFLILLSSLIIVKTKKVWPLLFVWLLCAMSIPVDYPNLILMFPIGIYGLMKIVNISKVKDKLNINLKWLGVFTFLGLIPPIIFFAWFNTRSYGDPLQFSGTVDSVLAIDENGKPTTPKVFSFENIDKTSDVQTSDKSALSFFKSRNILNGFYLHFLSPDRGIVFFTPVILLGILGITILQKNKNEYLPMLLGVVLMNIVLYSMWGDPWGGWAFGSRYLIPSYAIMAIFTGVALSEFRRKWLFLVIFLPVLIYSILVNTLGALTTSTNPPKVEVLLLEAASGKRERYSIDRNWEFLNNSGTKSFMFKTWAKNYVNSVYYYYIVSGIITSLTLILLISIIIKKDKN